MTEDAPTDAAPSRRRVGRPFEKGNTYGRGNPLAKRQAQYRAAFAEAVTDDDMETLARAMLMAACEGDTQAARIVLEYTAGKPLAAEVEEGSGEEMPKGRLEIRFVPAAAPPRA